MRIDRIEKSKHKQERVLVFLEGGDLLRITGAELLRFGLYKGMDLTPELVVELQAAAQKSELKQTAARMASGQMLSKKEVQRRLTKKGATEQEAEKTADWLESLGAVDDAGYAGVIVRHYGAMGYGAGRVRQELHRRGVPKELWDAALEQLPPPEEAIRKFLAGKLRGRGMTPEDSRRLAAALRVKGRAVQGHKICVLLAGPAVGDDGVELLQKCVPVIQLLGVHGASSSDGFLLSCHIPPGFARFVGL